MGLSTAYYFKKKHPKARVILFERGILPSGASTKNAGFACFGSISELQEDLTKMPEDLVWETVEMRYKGLLNLRKILSDRQLHYEASGGFEVFDNKQSFEKCQESIPIFNQILKSNLNLKNTYKISHSAIETCGMSGFKFAILNQHEGQIHSGSALFNLTKLVRDSGVYIINGFNIKKIIKGNGNILLLSENGEEVKCSKVVVCTNGFARQLLPQLKVEPARSQVIVTEPIPGLKLKGAFHYDSGYYYFRNVGNRVLLGGGRNLDFIGENTFDFGTTQLIQKKLKQILNKKVVPYSKPKIAYRWSGIMGVGSEKKPIVKLLTPNLICAVRMGGMGVAIGSLIGEQAAKLAE